MKIHTSFEQNSLEWLTARAGVVTASEFDNLVTPKWKIRTGDTVESYLHRKLAERWIDGPLPSRANSIDMDIGHIMEEEARPWFEFETGKTVQTVAFITSDDGRIGCSPDGLIGEHSGLEIKCPLPQTQTGYLLDGAVPDCYLAQVHGSMYVTGRASWHFLSYCRKFPPLLLHVEYNPKIQSILHEAISAFLERLDAGWKQLCERNGGPPERKAFKPMAEPEPEPVEFMP